MKVLTIGSGGREHALVWKVRQSPLCTGLFVAPGNGGTKKIAKNVSIPATNIEALAAFAKQEKIDLTIVGPEDPLASGIVKKFQGEGLKIFGPTTEAAGLETSKVDAKKVMAAAGVPTASYQVFTEYSEAREYIRRHGVPIVVKASGLALGKGAYVCLTMDMAEHALEQLMTQRVHGAAGDQVVIEQYLPGKEVSIHALCDGQNALLLPPSQDHKRAFDGDQGPNTGGMGAIAPVPWIDDRVLGQIKTKIVMPTINELRRQGRSYSGCLYPGLMITPEGPSVLEFNARFGDPETQPLMRLLKSDLLEAMLACAEGNLGSQQLEIHPLFAVCVVLASGGYPGKYEKGFPITGLEQTDQMPGVVVFHAGTTESDGCLVTSGGRVLGVSAVGKTLDLALARAYRAVDCIQFEGKQFRKDIGAKALQLNRTAHT